jgi:hypothetical protein
MHKAHSFNRLDLQVARIASSVVMLAGILVLIGWMLDLAISYRLGDDEG